MLVSTGMGCGSEYKGYDEDLRVEDTRVLTDAEYSFYNVVGTDDYGRQIITVDGKENDDVYVGMFFFLSLGQHSNHTGIYDVSKITVGGEDLDAFQTDSTASPLGAAHFWGEPVWGYYNSTDEWVMRKQIELLTMAGIDFIVLDTSNGVLYKQCTDVLFPVMKEFYDKGWNVPKVVYYLQANDAENKLYTDCLRSVYNNFYATETYKDLWFTPNGKPMIIRHELASDAYLATVDGGRYLDFFDFKTRQWPINDYFKDDGASWIEFGYPQPIHGDWMSISIAQHYSVRFSDTVGTHGRGWDEVTLKNDHENYGKGLNYQSQWDTAFYSKEIDEGLRFAFITGWNEWVAEKMVDGDGTYFTVDQFNEEYSRDIEPTRNSIGDNFYLQTIQNVKKFNYTEAKHYIYPKLNIDTSLDDGQWNDVKTYRDFTGECKARNARGFVPTRVYKDNSNRNDIDTIKVVRDDEYLYFRVTAVENITEPTADDKCWMNIFIRTDNGKHLYNGYDYVINRTVSGGKTTVMQGVKNGLKTSGEGEVYLYGKAMIVKVPLSALGLSSTNYHIEFKVADNIKDTEDYLDFYSTGDSAPIGRLNFSFGY